MSKKSFGNQVQKDLIHIIKSFCPQCEHQIKQSPTELKIKSKIFSKTDTQKELIDISGEIMFGSDYLNPYHAKIELSSKYFFSSSLIRKFKVLNVANAIAKISEYIKQAEEKCFEECKKVEINKQIFKAKKKLFLSQDVYIINKTFKDALCSCLICSQPSSTSNKFQIKLTFLNNMVLFIEFNKNGDERYHIEDFKIKKQSDFSFTTKKLLDFIESIVG